MTESARPCQATTKLGAPCKNPARPGSKYCAVHRRLHARPEPAAQTAQVTAALAGLDELVEELQEAAPTYQPPPYSPGAMLALLQQNAEKLADKVPVVGELRRNLEGTKPEDLVDPETWKGLWYILNYTAQAQTRQTIDTLVARLAQLPGGGTLLVVKSQVESTSPKDLLDIETWKGAWVILNAAVQAQADGVRRRVLGDKDEE
jgi:hypothetical protein